MNTKPMLPFEKPWSLEYKIITDPPGTFNPPGKEDVPEIPKNPEPFQQEINKGPLFQEEDVENAYQIEKKKKELEAKARILEQFKAQEAARIEQEKMQDPVNWTIEQTKAFYKQSPAQSIEEEAVREALLKAKEQEKNTILENLLLPSAEATEEKPAGQEPKQEKEPPRAPTEYDVMLSYATGAPIEEVQKYPVQWTLAAPIGVLSRGLNTVIGKLTDSKPPDNLAETWQWLNEEVPSQFGAAEETRYNEAIRAAAGIGIMADIVGTGVGVVLQHPRTQYWLSKLLYKPEVVQVDEAFKKYLWEIQTKLNPAGDKINKASPEAKRIFEQQFGGNMEKVVEAFKQIKTAGGIQVSSPRAGWFTNILAKVGITPGVPGAAKPAGKPQAPAQAKALTAQPTPKQAQIKPETALTGTISPEAGKAIASTKPVPKMSLEEIKAEMAIAKQELASRKAEAVAQGMAPSQAAREVLSGVEAERLKALQAQRHKLVSAPQAGGLGQMGEGFAKVVERLKARGITIVERGDVVRIDKDTQVKDIYGNKITLPKGEEFTAYKLSNGQIWMHDGKNALITKNQFDNVEHQNIKLGEQFAPELEGVEEVVKGKDIQDVGKFDIEEFSRNPENYGWTPKKKEASYEWGEYYLKGKNVDPEDTYGNWTLYKNGKEIGKFDYATLAMESVEKQDLTKFSQYQLPGGENYEEIAWHLSTLSNDYQTALGELKQKLGLLPSATVMQTEYYATEKKGVATPETEKEFWDISKKYSEQATGRKARGDFYSHAYPDKANNYGWERHNWRTTPDGKKVYFVEELQHVKPKELGGIDNITMEQYKALPDYAKGNKFYEVALRGIIKRAVEGGADYIAFTTGEQQAERYDLSRYLDRVEAQKTDDGRYIIKAVDKEGKSAIDEIYSADKLPSVVGKELADKIVGTTYPKTFGIYERKIFEGSDFKVGGEWAKNLYDKQVPNILKDLTKGSVENIEIGTIKKYADPTVDKGYYEKNVPSTQPALKITPEIKARVIGQPMAGGKAPKEGGEIEYLYHVTPTQYIDSIKEKGLVPMASPSNWVKAGDKTRYGKGEIYTFDNLTDAAKWAAKMDWEFNKEIGSGKISIVRLKKSGEWTIDTSDPLSQVGAKGKWLKSIRGAKKEDIDTSIPLTSDITKKLTAIDPDLSDMFSKLSPKEGGQKPPIEPPKAPPAAPEYWEEGEFSQTTGGPKTPYDAAKNLPAGQRKGALRQATGLWQPEDIFIPEKEALKRLMQRQAWAAKKAYSAGTKEGIQEEKVRKARVLEALKERRALRARYMKAASGIEKLPHGNIDPKYKEVIEGIKKDLDLAFHQQKTLDSLAKTKDFIARMEKEGVATNIPDYRKKLLDKKSLNSFSVTEVEELAKMVENLNHLGRTMRKAKDNLEYTAHKQRVAELTQAIEATARRRHKASVGQGIVGTHKDKSFTESLKKSVMEPVWFYHLHNIRGERLADLLDGYQNYKGPHSKEIYMRLERAQAKEQASFDKVQDDFAGFIKKENVNLLKVMDDKYEIKKGQKLTGAQKIGVYLYSLNDHTRTQLLYGNNFSPEDIESINKSLTTDEKKIATWLLNHYQQQRPAVAQAYAQETGELLGEQENYSPGMIDFGEGPKVYDQQLMDELEQIFNVKLATEKGFTKERVANIRPLKLDALENFYKNLGMVSHYTAFASDVKKLRRVMADKDYYAEIEKYGLQKEYHALDEWLKATATKNVGVPIADTWRWLTQVRHNTAIGLLGYNLITITKQFPSYVSGALYDGPAGGMWALSGLMQRIAHPIELKDFVYARSPYMKDRMIERDLHELAEDMRKKGYIKKVDQAVLDSVGMLRWMDRNAVLSLWKGSYDRVMKHTKGNEQKAIEEADGLIRRTQPSGRVMDLAEFMREPHLKLFTQFMNQLNNYYNIITHDILGYGAHGQDKAKERAGLVAARLLGIILASILVESLARLARPRNIKQVAQDIGANMAGTLTFFGPIVKGTLQGRGYDEYSVPALQTIFDFTRGAGKGIEGMIKKDPELVKKGALKMLEMGARGLGIPITQPLRTAKGAVDLATGQATDLRRLVISKWSAEQGGVEGEFKETAKNLRYHQSRYDKLSEEDPDAADKYYDKHPELDYYADMTSAQSIISDYNADIKEILKDKSLSLSEKRQQVREIKAYIKEEMESFLETYKGK